MAMVPPFTDKCELEIGPAPPASEILSSRPEIRMYQTNVQLVKRATISISQGQPWSNIQIFCLSNSTISSHSNTVVV